MLIFPTQITTSQNTMNQIYPAKVFLLELLLLKLNSLQCVERSLKPKRPKFLQQPMSIATMVTW